MTEMIERTAGTTGPGPEDRDGARWALPEAPPNPGPAGPAGPTAGPWQAPTAGPMVPGHRAHRSRPGRFAKLARWARSDAHIGHADQPIPARPTPVPAPTTAVPAPVPPDPATPPGPGGSEVTPPAEPRWLALSIGLGLAGLTVAAGALTYNGQVTGARWASVGWWQSYLVPGVLEAVAVLWMLMGYRRGRYGDSPWAYWLISAMFGAYAVVLVAEHTPGDAAWYYGGASITTQVLTFIKFYEDLRRWRAHVLKQTAKARARFGALWRVKPGLARRAALIATEYGITNRAVAVRAAHIWLPVFEDTRDQLRHPGPDDGPRTSRRQARRLARRSADWAVAADLGQPLPSLPERLRVMRSHLDRDQQAPAGPARDLTVPPAWSSGTGRGMPEAPVSPAPAGPGPVPALVPAGPPADPTVPAGPTVAQMLAWPAVAAVAAEVAERAASYTARDLPADLGRLDTAFPGWLTGPDCPTKRELAERLERGNTNAGHLRRLVDAVRREYATGAAGVATAPVDA